MKKNDPKNLRIPAVRLITELLPEGSTAGVWLFAEDVTPLIEVANVDADWKKRSRQSAAKIHSRGQFTDIESILRSASADWQRGDVPSGTRHLVLLTDGVVDIAKDPNLNANSRQRVLNEVLESLRTLGVNVHTIALSKSSDRELMETIAKKTDGWSREVDRAGELQRVFLHMFEKATKPDSVPLEGNKFEIDSAISEMTLLVFRQADAAPTTLRSPDGAIYSQNTKDEKVKWISEQSYDLVTISKPAVGDWRINADIDPDNRVLVVTDVKLVLDQLPNNLFVNETLNLGAWLTEKNRPIERLDFLKLIDVSVNNSAQDRPIPLAFDSHNRRFSVEQAIDWGAGDYELLVAADSGTFKRQQRRRISVFESAVVFDHKLIDHPEGGHELIVTATATPQAVVEESLFALVLVNGISGNSELHELNEFSNGIAEKKIRLKPGEYLIQPRAFGRMQSGRIINIEATPFVIGAGIVPTAREDEQQAASAPQTTQASIEMLATAAIIGIGNLGVALVLLPLWYLLRRRAHKPTLEVAVA